MLTRHNQCFVSKVDIYFYTNEAHHTHRFPAASSWLLSGTPQRYRWAWHRFPAGPRRADSALVSADELNEGNGEKTTGNKVGSWLQALSGHWDVWQSGPRGHFKVTRTISQIFKAVPRCGCRHVGWKVRKKTRLFADDWSRCEKGVSPFTGLYINS